MIYIAKNTSNTVVLTLNEKQTLTNPDFLFEFVHDDTGEQKLFTTNDLSSYTDRFNKFTITDNTTEDEYNGTMDFQKGFHHYTIYEMTQGSPNDLDPDNAVSTLETGKVYVEDTTNSDVEFTEDDETNNVTFDED